MTDVADKPDGLAGEPVAGAPARRERHPWSPEDRRNLLISVGGGIASGLVVVLVLGVAIAIARQVLGSGTVFTAAQLRDLARLPANQRAQIEHELAQVNTEYSTSRHFYEWATFVLVVATAGLGVVWRLTRRRFFRRAAIGTASLLFLVGLPWLGVAAGIHK